MKTWPLIAALFVAAATVGFAAARQTTMPLLAAPVVAASASATAQPSAAVTLAASAPTAKLPLGDAGSVAWPTDDGVAPEDHEWKTAAPFKLARPIPAARCSAKRIRQWLRISCREVDSAQLLGGPTEGVTLHDRHITFPVRRGDRRLFQLLQGSEDIYGSDSGNRGGFSTTLVHAISEQWLEDEVAPTIVVR